MLRGITGGLIALLMIGMGAVALTQRAETQGAETQKTDPSPAKMDSREEQFARQVIDLTNKERARYNLAPLTQQKNLSAAASWMARDLAQNPSFSHTDRQGRNIEARLPAFGYTDWRSLGENIAAGQTTPEKVVEAWMHSPGHRRNILASSFREIGIGYYYVPNNKFKRFWVQDFGTRQ
jgi:uncharacterized protein YkwD